MPGAPNVLEDVHRSCAEVAALHREHVSIDEAALVKLAAELAAAADDVRGAVRGLPLPIRFSSLEQELTLLALFHLLDFGSGYLASPESRKQSGGREWREALLYGLLGLHLGGTRLDSHKLKSFSMYDVHQVFGLDATVEVPVMPGVTMSKPGPLQPLCKSLLAALNDTGAQLAEGGHKTPGGLLLAIGEELGKAGRTSASAFVEELVDTLPSFRDTVLYDGRTLVLQRRAQNLAADLACVYGGREGGGRFAFPDVEQLAGDSGSTTIAALRAKGVLRVADPDLAATLDSGAELPAGPHERALRAAAVIACDRLAAAANAKLAGAGSGDSSSGVAAAAAVVAAPGGSGQAPPVEGVVGSAAEAEAEAGGKGAGAELSAAAAGPAASGAAAVADGGDGGGGSGSSSKGGGATAIRPVDVGAYMCYLTEPGRELADQAKPHVTLGVTAY